MRRSDIAHVSIIPDGVDYIFTRLDYSSEGSAYYSGHRFRPCYERRLAILSSVLRRRLSRYGVKTLARPTSHGIVLVFSPKDDRISPLLADSELVSDVSTASPLDVEVPNLPVDVDSWGR
jgi:hypothetical protein